MNKRFSISKGILSLMIMLVAVIALVACEGGNNNQKLVDEAYNALQVAFQSGDSSTSVTKNVTFPPSVGEVTITWVSSNTAVISNTGVVTRGQSDTVVSITATLKLGDVEETKVFTLTVKAAPVVIDPVDALNAITITGSALTFDAGTQIYTTTANVSLPTVSQTLAVTWSSTNPSVVSTTGVVVRPAWNTADSTVILTATIGDETRDFAIRVLAITEKPDSAKLSDAFNSLLLAGIGNGVATDLVLPLVVGTEGVTVTWSSSNTDVIANDGKVTRQQDQVMVTLTATLTIGSETIDKEFEVVVLPFAEYVYVDGIQEAIQLSIANRALTPTVDTYVKIEGVTVVGVSGDGYMIYDGANLLFVFTNSAPAATIKAGDVYDITGFVDYYFGSWQLNGTRNTEMPTILAASDEPAAVLEPTALTGSLKTYIDTLPITYTQEAGFPYAYLQVEAKVRVQGTGNYDVFFVDLDYNGANINSAANSPHTDNALMVYYKSNIADVRLFDGAKVTINLFLYSYRTDRTIFTVIFTGTAEDIEILPMSDQEAVAGAKAAATSAVNTQFLANATLTLPTEAFDATIAWASDDEATINPTTGAVTVTEGEYKTVTLTATITKGSVSDELVVVVKVGIPPVSSIQTVIDADVNSTYYRVKGTVTASEYYRTYFIQSGDEGIAIYTSNAGMLATLKANVGKEVEVIGSRAAFSGLRQMSPVQITAVGEGEVIVALNADAVELSAEAMLPFQGRLVTLTELVVSNRAVDNFNNVTLTLTQALTGKTVQMKWDSRVALSTEAQALLDSLVVDVVINLTSVLAWNNNPYFYFTDTTIATVVTLSDASKVQMDAAALTQPTSLAEAGSLVLPSEGANGSSIVWTTDSDLVDLVAKTITVPAEGQVTVTLTATVSLNGETQVVNFEIKVGTFVATVFRTYTFGTVAKTGYAAGNVTWTESFGDQTLAKDRVQINVSNFDPHSTMGAVLVLAPITTVKESYITFDFTAFETLEQISFEYATWSGASFTSLSALEGGILGLQVYNTATSSWDFVEYAAGQTNLLGSISSTAYNTATFNVNGAGMYRIAYNQPNANSTTNTAFAVTVDNLALKG